MKKHGCLIGIYRVFKEKTKTRLLPLSTHHLYIYGSIPVLYADWEGWWFEHAVS